MSDKISIAIATYNGEKYLREQLESLYSQTMSPDEIIVVDDCSTDNTITILEEYHQRYGLKYYVNEKNLGVNKNFEKAILLCNGDYIALCDQDDVWLPHKIETTYKKIKEIENNEPALVSSLNISVDKDLNVLSKPKPKEGTDLNATDYSKTLLGHYSQGCTLMMNRKLVKQIIPLPENEIVYDIYIGLVAAMIGNKCIINEPLMLYRHHNNNVLGKINNEKNNISKKFKCFYRNKYPGFLPDMRFNTMEYIKNLHYQDFKNERLNLFNKLLLLNKPMNLSQEVKIIISIKELPFKKKIRVIFNRIISIIYNYLDSNNLFTNLKIK